MVRLSLWERKMVISHKVDADNTLDISRYLLMLPGNRSAANGRMGTLERMQYRQRAMLSRGKAQGGKISEPEAMDYTESMLEDFRNIMSGEDRHEVLKIARDKTVGIFQLPEGTELADANGQRVLFADYYHFSDVFYPLRALETRKGRFSGKFRQDEIDWWKSAALHNFQENHYRPSMVLDPRCAEWLLSQPEHYRKILLKLANYRGDWSSVAKSPELIGEIGERELYEASAKMKDYASKNCRILSLYPKILDNDSRGGLA